MKTLRSLATFFLLLPVLSLAQPAVTAPIPVKQLQGFKSYPDSVQKLILNAQTLSKAKLGYIFGSADPSRHGMDCSGTINYLLKQMGFYNPPRTANQLYLWAKQKGDFHTVKKAYDLDSREFAQLKPGDLLFWSGTYPTSDKNKITHVMIYLGKNKQNEPLIFGSDDGRFYNGRPMWGVSVFNFYLPTPGMIGKFVGYSCVPGLTCA